MPGLTRVFVMSDHQLIVNPDTIGHVRFAGEPLIVALVAVKACGVAIHALALIATNGIAIVQAGRVGADPTRKVLGAGRYRQGDNAADEPIKPHRVSLHPFR